MLARCWILDCVWLPFLVGISCIACNTSTPHPTTPNAITASAKLTSAPKLTSLAVLEPPPSDKPSYSWILVNRNPDAIVALQPWPGLFGTIERRGENGQWYSFPHPQGHCATVNFDPELAPGETLWVGELPRIGGERTLPPGRYRFVLPHKRASMPRHEFAAVLPFAVQGLNTQESQDLVRLLERADIRACHDVWSYLLETIQRTGASDILPSLFSATATTLDEQIQIFTVLAHFPEQLAELAAATNDNGLRGLGAAVTILENIRPGAATRAALDRLVITLEMNEDPPLRVARALTGDIEHWPANVVPHVIAQIERTTSDPHRIALASVLQEAGRKTLAAHGRRAVQAIRRAAHQTRDEKVRASLRELASQVAEIIGDEPPQNRPGQGLEEVRDDDIPTDTCRRLFEELRVQSTLRFTPAARNTLSDRSFRITYEHSYVEPYRKPTTDEPFTPTK